MRSKVLAAVVAATACVSLAGPGVATAGTMLSTDLVGLEERPGPGDPDGVGFIELTMNQGRGEICFNISLSGLDTITGGHIHRGAAGSFGDVVVALFGSNGFGDSCVDASKATIKEIRRNPSAFYVNVHTTAYPAGAVRGQLGD